MLSIRAETTLSTYGSLEIARWKRRKKMNNNIGLFQHIHPLRMTQILDPCRTTLGSCCNPLGHILGESGSPWQCSLPSGCHGNSPRLLVTSTVEGTLVQEPWEVLPPWDEHRVSGSPEESSMWKWAGIGGFQKMNLGVNFSTTRTTISNLGPPGYSYVIIWLPVTDSMQTRR